MADSKKSSSSSSSSSSTSSFSSRRILSAFAAVLLCGFLFCLFGAVVFQHGEITSLKTRLSSVETIHVTKRSEVKEQGIIQQLAEELTSLSRDSRQATPSTNLDPALLTLISNLVQSETESLTNFYCGDATKICQQGAPGTKGEPGTPGAQGSPGLPGPHGADGAAVPKGEQGLAGLAGAQGLPGAPGPKGEPGRDGLKGDPGIVGSAGLRGERGQRGEKGELGVAGRIGPSGPPGPKGEAGSGGGFLVPPHSEDSQCCARLAPPTATNTNVINIVANAGSDVLLPCSASGYPPPKVTWNPSVPTSARIVTSQNGMTIHNVNVTDEETFKCEVSNVFGKTAYTINLAVKDPLVVSVNPPAANLKEHDNLNLTCVYSGYPIPSVTWLHFKPDGSNVTVPTTGQTMVTSNGRQGISTLMLTDLDAAKAGGYECRVANSLEVIGQQAKITVEVTFSLHDNLNLTCVYSGYPIPSVTWLHFKPDGSNVTVPTTGQTMVTSNGRQGISTLMLTDLDAAKAGGYECRVANSLEVIGQQAKITVEAGPYIFHRPQSQTAQSGQTVRLYCDVVADPPAQITWIYPQGGQPFNARVLPDNSLLLTGVDTYNEDSYTCKATNSYGVQTASANLTVLVPVNVTALPAVTSLMNNPYVALTCTGSGEPKPTLSWSKLQAALPQDPRYIVLPATGDLIISGIDAGTQERDSGIYVCSGTNGRSTDKDYAIVYKDLGNLNCDAMFESCGTIGAVCAGTCPANCGAGSGVVKGYKDYTLDSSICLSGVHAGVSTAGQGGQVMWQVQNGQSANITSVTAHGITSLADGQQPVVAGILHPSAPNPLA